MKGTVGVVIGTYGDKDEWDAKALRAEASVQNQTVQPDEFTHVHSTTLAQARNLGAHMLKTDFLIFLDADDELDDRYIEEMRNALVFTTLSHPICRPSTLGVYEDGSTDEKPVMIPRTDLRRANCIVIGAMCPSDLFYEVGGFGEWPILEDWALWRTLVYCGAWIKDVPHAIYRVHVNPNSRNSDENLHRNTYRDIIKAIPL